MRPEACPSFRAGGRTQFDLLRNLKEKIAESLNSIPSGLLQKATLGVQIILKIIGSLCICLILILCSCGMAQDQVGIEVTSDPSGAEVFIDGGSKGFADPTLNIALPEGGYNVVCKLAGYRDYSVDVMVESDAITPVPCTLSKIGSPTVRIETEKKRIEAGKISNITVIVRTDRSPLPGARVELSSSQGGGFTDTSGITDQDGIFVTGFSAFSEGEYEILARAKGTAISEEGMDSARIIVFSVSEGSVPGWKPILVIALIILILAGAGAYLWTRNKLEIQLPKGKTLLCDEKSTLPIRVQFVNGLGRLKKQGTERQLEMEATSGSIEKVLIEAGKASADVMLTSSNQCGLVTITARWESQEAKAQVEFTADEAGLDLEVDKPEISADSKSQAEVTIRVRSREGVHIISQNEKVIDLETTHGRITSPVKIPPGAIEGTAILTAGDRSGTATITAVSGLLKGETILNLASPPKKYCMWCGQQMMMEEKICPNCGNIPPSHTDTKTCPSCGTILPKNANHCMKCGVKQPDGNDKKTE